MGDNVRCCEKGCMCAVASVELRRLLGKEPEIFEETVRVTVNT